jgi:hypothetical protein
LELKANYLLDIKAAKNSLITHPECPELPDSLWFDILGNQFLNLDKVFSGYYALASEGCHTQTIGDLDITLHTGGSKPTRSIKTHGEWSIAYDATKTAILFAYPHRGTELIRYEKFIKSQFAAIDDPAMHFWVINLD